jgi:nucleotide-binding universal stress UspA family protein
MSAGAGRIVVGIDGSQPSREALRWAVAQAVLTSGRVQAVIAWSHPLSSGLPVLAEVDWRGDARRALDVALAEVLGEGAAAVEPCAMEGHPARVLLQAAKGADLLVVGSRGHGGFAGVLLGSVSDYVVKHAPCPVVVVRPVAQPTAVPA